MDDNFVEQLVVVGYLPLEWFFADRLNFVAFSTMLTGLSSNFYETAFAKYLLDQFWHVAQREIVLKQFIPYLIFLSIAIYSFHLALDK